MFHSSIHLPVHHHHPWLTASRKDWHAYLAWGDYTHLFSQGPRLCTRGMLKIGCWLTDAKSRRNTKSTGQKAGKQVENLQGGHLGCTHFKSAPRASGDGESQLYISLKTHRFPPNLCSLAKEIQIIIPTELAASPAPSLEGHWVNVRGM